MSNPENIPKPKDSGSDGSQVEDNESTELVESNQLSELSLAHTIKGIAASNTRALGTEVTSALIAGATTQMASELQYSKSENQKLQNKIDVLNEHLSDEKVENAVLKERITSSHQHRHLRNLGIAVGTTMLTVSIPLFDSQQYQTYGYVSLAIGALLVAMGWFSPVRGGGK